MEYRIESDSLGEVKVPANKYYGAQTQRSFENFQIGKEKMPWEVVLAYAYIKKASSIVNLEMGKLEEGEKQVICQVCDEILSGQISEDHFPLLVWQTGSGTQTNMNVNEVISNRAIEKLGGEMGSKKPIHPNDHVNCSQSSNDTFPTAMHLSAYLMSQKKLLPSIDRLSESLNLKVKLFEKIVKIGRTHLMDATPLTLGQEFSAYLAQIQDAKRNIERMMDDLSYLAQGATAVGSGINSPEGFGERFSQVVSDLTQAPFKSASNKFASIASHDILVAYSGALKQLGCALMKIANDIRWLASGPRCAIGELSLPANEPGSSIMPGKVNPTQCEAVTMVVAQVYGNDTSIAFAGSQGNFQLNVYKPVMIYNLLQSIELLSDVMDNFDLKCIQGIQANEEKITSNMQQSLMLATALAPHIGYDKTSKIVQKAFQEGITLKKAALDLNSITEKDFDKVMDPLKMVRFT